MSDLDFLNATLAQPTPPRASASTVPNDTDLPANPATNGAQPKPGDAGVPDDILKSLEGLSADERAAFAPLLQALSATSTTNGNGAAPGNPVIGAQDVHELLKQLDAADSVAETLEGKLDRLLESLGEVEDAFPEEQESGDGARETPRRPSVGEGRVGPQQLPETMAGEAKNAFEEVAKDRE
jgi:hypothetical protein